MAKPITLKDLDKRLKKLEGKTGSGSTSKKSTVKKKPVKSEKRTGNYQGKKRITEIAAKAKIIYEKGKSSGMKWTEAIKQASKS